MITKLKDSKLTKSIASRTVALGVLAGVGIAAPSQAAVVYTGCGANATSCTLNQLFGGATITVGDKLFNNWTQVKNIKNNVNGQVQTNNIQVSGIFQDTNAPGLDFSTTNNALDFFNQGSLELNFDFQVTVLDPKQKINDNELKLGAFVANAANEQPSAEINELIGTRQGLSDLGNKSVFVRIGQQDLEDSAKFSPQQSVWVRKLIKVNAPETSTASIGNFQQRFSQTTTEPNSIFAFIGISSIGLMLKYKQKTTKR